MQDAKTRPWRRYVYILIAAEINATTRYFDKLIQTQPLTDDDQTLFNAIPHTLKTTCTNTSQLPEQLDQTTHCTLLLNGNLNYDFDIEGLLNRLRSKIRRQDRIVVVLFNSYLKGLYHLANIMGWRRGRLPENFVTRSNLANIAALAGFQVVRHRSVAYFPFKAFGLGDLINKVLPVLPILRWFSLTSVVVLRPIVKEKSKPGLSIIIPARNEKGNIQAAIDRIPHKKKIPIEIIFVEGHSNDGTYTEIEKVAKAYKGPFSIKLFQQTGKGKADAVRLGFSKASYELLTILDADLTMPPELIYRFYDAYVSGKADFINGSRLVYPMEGEAMRFLNHLGNLFFAASLSWVLGTRITDSLCGTKLMSAGDYKRMQAWRKDFGDFDPFGDFELLFPASVLGLGIIDVPIRYRARTYGSTNISRFRHGLMLLKMTVIGLLRLRSGIVR